LCVEIFFWCALEVPPSVVIVKVSERQNPSAAAAIPRYSQAGNPCGADLQVRFLASEARAKAHPARFEAEGSGGAAPNLVMGL